MILLGEKAKEYIDFYDAKIIAFGTPLPLHGVNPRSMLSTTEWDQLRRETYRKYNYKCGICGASGKEQGFNHPVEAHELWDYDFENEIQIFNGLIALCPICHRIYHWDQSRMALQDGKMTKNEFERIDNLRRSKLRELNGTTGILDISYKKAFRWHDGKWKSDFSLLKRMGYVLAKVFDTKWNGYYFLSNDGYYYPYKGNEHLAKVNGIDINKPTTSKFLKGFSL